MKCSVVGGSFFIIVRPVALDASLRPVDRQLLVWCCI